MGSPSCWSCRGRKGACMTFVLVVDDDPAMRRTLVDQPAGPRLRGRDGGRRPVGPAGRRRADARRGPARPGAARPRRRRGAHAAAVLHAGPGDRGLGPHRVRRQGRGARPRRRRLHHQAVLDRGAARPDPGHLAPGGPRGARPGRRGRRAAPRPHRLPRHPRRRGDPPDPHRVADRRGPRPPPRPAGAAGRAAARGVGARRTTPRPTTSGSTWPASVASSRPTRVGPCSSSPSRGWATGSLP